MELVKSQKLMARFFTDAAFRDRVRRKPAIALSELQLSSADLEWFNGFVLGEGQYFADALIRKRLGQINNSLPLTKWGFGGEFNDLFYEYASRSATHGVNRHLNDAISFCKWLRVSSCNIPKWLLDIVDYEQNWLEAMVSRRGFFKIRFYTCNIVGFMDSYKSKKSRQQRKPTIVIWWRLSAQSEPKERAFYPRYWPY